MKRITLFSDSLVRRCDIPTYKRLPRGKRKPGGEFKDWSLHALIWLRYNWKSAVEFIVVAIVAVGVLFGARQYWRHQSAAAADSLYEAIMLGSGSDEQIKSMTHVVKEWPRTASGKQAMMILGEIYLDKGEHDKATELFRLLASRSRNNAMVKTAALHNLAETQLAMGEADLAAETYVKAAADPHNLLALDSRIRAAASFERAGKFKEAAMLYSQIIDEAGDDDRYVKDKSEERLLWLMANGRIEGPIP